ncbi:cob(I)yrinic acid a,c-diamide adenosyltransferase [Cysteiniphilum sp. QT6929]|uniref:cob(I)yrinic acid a,c-diamide adenosyltransferase n=1 Tax=Cysteiniphilum sp. QT6929 TaxID=2975055 RepID=UPI0024B3C210|nr:cob(I)yrinic acid a,c-diamide adenosyltransferase [Cysteiniphilum sp. QT6929]WHN65940.1 cob(I)yrinic acid a,c-diamide adenosyltransferase [Cysteiniphilum sp. QT6929]
MGHRLSKIYTKTGDKGTTALSDNIRIDKCAPIIETIGQIDELNAAIGVIVAFSNNLEINNQLQNIQHHLFNIGGELSFPQFSQLTDQAITALEIQIDQWNESLPPLKEFILPGGSQCAALSHQARTIARKAERHYVALIQDQTKAHNPLILSFLNRLSDYLFVLARFFNQLDQHDEVLWKSHRSDKTQEKL